MTHHDIPDTHPRKQSLMLREKIINGLGSNIVATAGLVAHGRGEAFDYILGEQTLPAARTAIDAAAALLTTATRPVISVNGNTAALSAPELVALSAVTGAPLEINLFYRSPEREQAILSHLTEHGATRVLGVGNRATGRVPDLAGPRGQVDPEGILQADVVFLALEDGDRTEQLARLGKKIIAVDLNPFSRTAQYAHVTIVDNIVRVMPLLIAASRALQEDADPKVVQKRITSYDNAKILGAAVRAIQQRLKKIARQGIYLRIEE